MECPICYNIITNSCIGSCTHHFCLPCLIQWCSFGGTNCPTCKTPIIEIRCDKEFDSINNPEDNTISITNMTNKFTIKFDKNDIAGITLENNYNFSGFGTRAPGVTISKINERHKCYKSGLRKNDILLFLNSIPCVDHKQSINIIDVCVLANMELKCLVLNKEIPH